MLDLPIRYSIRGVTEEDEEGLLDVAAFLDSVNLPNDPDVIRQTISSSVESFSGERSDPRRRQYVFVLRDELEGRVIGTSMVLGQKGRKDAPYIYFSVKDDEKYSPHLDRHFIHRVLQIGYSYDGPTEIGGLVMHPDLRRSPRKLGMLISYVRFLWIAMHRRDFQSYVLAELMPPLEDDGTSQLWEAVGRHFTGMSYRDADRLSKHNKQFIRSLFPDAPIYASLLSEAAQATIGRVGPQTRGVEKLLRRLGFRYVDRVDPFDGGPHFAARTDDVLLVKRSRALTLEAGEGNWAGRALVAREHAGPPWFEAFPSPFRPVEGRVMVPPEVLERVGDGDAWFLELD